MFDRAFSDAMTGQLVCASIVDKYEEWLDGEEQMSVIV